MPDTSRFAPMVQAFMSGPNMQAGSEWRTAHPRIDQFLTNNPGWQPGQGMPSMRDAFSGGGGPRPGGIGGGGFMPNGPGGMLGDIPHTMAPGLLPSLPPRPSMPNLGGGMGMGPGGGGGFSGGMPPMKPPQPGGYDSSGITAGYNPAPKPTMTNMGPGVGLAPPAGGMDMARRVPKIRQI